MGSNIELSKTNNAVGIAKHSRWMTCYHRQQMKLPFYISIRPKFLSPTLFPGKIFNNKIVLTITSGYGLLMGWNFFEVRHAERPFF